MQLSSTTTTTPAHGLKSPYRFWGKTLDILGCLSEFGGLTPREISEKTGHRINDIRKACKRVFYRGILEPNTRWGWRLTALGNLVLTYNNNNNRGTIEEKQGKNRGTIEEKQGKNRPIKTRQVNLSPFEKNEELDEYQQVVVVALVRHYEETGKKAKARPYLIVTDYTEFRQLVGLTSKLSEANVQDIVISLEVNGFLYIKSMGNRHLKIGLTKEIIERVKNC